MLPIMLHKTAESGAVTIAGTPAADELCVFRLSRKASDGGDTLNVDARMIGVTSKVRESIMAVDDGYTVVLMHFDGVDGSTDFIDESGKAWTNNNSDCEIDTARSKFGASSLLNGKRCPEWIYHHRRPRRLFFWF